MQNTPTRRQTQDVNTLIYSKYELEWTQLLVGRTDGHLSDDVIGKLMSYARSFSVVWTWKKYDRTI